MRRHLVIYCDSVGNFTIERGADGKAVRTPLNGHRAGVVACSPEGHVLGSGLFSNSVCPDQYAAACWAVLRGTEVAIDYGAELVSVRTQQVENLGSSTRQGYRGSRYLEIARDAAWKARVRCLFEPLLDSSINLAEFVAKDGLREPGEFFWYAVPSEELRGPSDQGHVKSPVQIPALSTLIRS